MSYAPQNIFAIPITKNCKPLLCVVCESSLTAAAVAKRCSECRKPICWSCSSELPKSSQCILCSSIQPMSKISITDTKHFYKPLPLSITSRTDEWCKRPLQIPIKNLGNTCYMNAALQLMLHVNLFEPFVDWFIRKDDTNMRDFILCIRKLYTKLQKIPLTDQCDSTLFFKYVLDFLRDRYADVCKEFLLEISSKLTCKICKTVCEPKEISDTMLTVYVKPTHKSFAEAHKSIVLSHVERKCEKCETSTRHIQRWKVKMKPWAFFHLQYIENASIEIPTHLHFPKGKEDPAFDIYELQGLIVHRSVTTGTHSDGGHYIFYGVEEQEWFEYDDDNITKMNVPHMVQLLKGENPYEYIKSQVVCAAYKLTEVNKVRETSEGEKAEEA